MKMKILIAGASGLVGSQLVPFLISSGHQVHKLVRHSDRKLGSDEIYWNPENEVADIDALEGFNAIINLSGENISAHRWTKAIKQKILESRVKSTTFIAKIINQLKKPPEVLINSSAIGIYGNRGDEKLVEASPIGVGFLAEICNKWESATATVSKNVRVIHLRTGMVVAQKGGALAKMLIPFKLGLGGELGSGKQYMSWIDMDDLVGLILFILMNQSVTGKVNGVAPHPVTNAEWTKTLARVLHRPTLFPFPAFAARLVFGELADALLLSSTRVYPEKLLSMGYIFQYPNLESCLKHQVK
jgi:uncharacterized protein